eukprot:m.262289 g.262289  ORF g.262289 m.262289 type:complete len:754 (+) comp16003_c0_seq1:60-2321(+)
MDVDEAGGGAAAESAPPSEPAPEPQPNGSESNGRRPDDQNESDRPAKKMKPAPPADDDDSDDDVPLSLVKAKSPPKKAQSPPKKSPARAAAVAAASAMAADGDDSDDGGGNDDDDSDDDVPLGKLSVKLPKSKPKKEKAKPEKRKPTKRPPPSDDEESESDDDVPISQIKKKTPKKAAPKEKKPKKEKAEAKPKKEKKEEEPVYKWWEEEELPDGQKWRTLEHRGPMFPPEYEPLPKTVQLRYDGEPFPLEPASEEIAGFYAQMLRTDYPAKKVFNNNFMRCWREAMTKDEKAKIKDLTKCDFTRMQAHYDSLSEARKAATKEEKAARKEKEEKIREEYGFAMLDGHKQKVGNFRLEPPGLFRGRGEHPKMGVLKKRLQPEDIAINIGDVSKAPPPPPGHKWKEVKSDNTVTWMASWIENVQGQSKYIMFNPESYLKGRNDLKKYELARDLKKHIEKIRRDYTTDLKNKITLDRQRATALYFIDKLALRAGGEKDTDEEADTVGCCNLRVEHVQCMDDLKIQFDFLGKDSIQYLNTVAVSPQVYKNVQIFCRGKDPGDDLFDRLTVPMLNSYLKTLMPGLTAKVFRTYNASTCLQDQLVNTPVDGTVEEKMLAYNKANKEVAILCNHQRAAPKGHGDQVEKLDEALATIKTELKAAKREFKSAQAEKDQKGMLKWKKKVETLKTRMHKKDIAKQTKEELKTIALGTSKLNYLDPRISVSWSMKHDVPIEKVYNTTQRAKFRWAIEMTKEDFVF